MLAVMSCLPACAYTTKKTVRQLVKEKENGNLAKLRPDFPSMQEVEDDIYLAAYQTAKGLVDGGLDSLSAEERDAAVQKAAEDLTKRIEEISEAAGRGASRGARNEIEPMVENIVNEIVRAGKKINIERAAVRITERVVDKLSERVAVGIDEQIGPAIGNSIRDDLGPALGETMDKDLKDPLGRMVRHSAAEAVYGFDEALTKVLEDRKGTEGDIFERLKGVLHEGEDLARWLLLIVVVTFVGIGVLIFLWLRQVKKAHDANKGAELARGEAALREQTLKHMVGVIHEEGNANPEAIKGLRGRIKGLREHDHEAYNELNRVVAQQGHWLPPSAK